MTSDPETLIVERRDGICFVTLNRPDAHNAFNGTMRRELGGLWRHLRRDDEVRVVVLTGAGDRAFCVGVDRKEVRDPADLNPAKRAGPFMVDDLGDELGPKSNNLWKPIVCAVNGMACGGAFYLLGEVDIVIASRQATFFDPHVSYGLASSYESMHMLQRMPLGELLRMQLMGNAERISADRAHQIGLVSEVVEADELAGAAERVAATIAGYPPLAVQGTLRATWAARELSRRQALDLGYAFVALGNDRDAIGAGQAGFLGGQRQEWRLR